MNTAAKGYERLLSWLAPLALLVAWELLVRAGILDERFFSPPSRIVASGWQMLLSGELWANTWASLYRTFVGFFLGAIPAIIVGMIMGLVPVVRAALNPLLSATYPIPKSAILPLIMIFLGLGDASKIVTIAIAVFYLVWINTMAGVLNIPSIYLDVGRNYGARGWNFYRTIAFPGALPLIFAGFKLGFGIALILIVVVEMVGADEGIGHLIWSSWQTFSMDVMFVSLIVISILGFVSTILLDAVERWVVPWKR